jgi:hypothetical protein
MQTVVHNISDLNEDDRAVVERLVGKPVRSDQQLVIQVTSRCAMNATMSRDGSSANKLPEWCSVYAGLSDDQLAELEAAILARSRSERTFE